MIKDWVFGGSYHREGRSFEKEEHMVGEDEENALNKVKSFTA